MLSMRSCGEMELVGLTLFVVSHGGGGGLVTVLREGTWRGVEAKESGDLAPEAGLGAFREGTDHCACRRVRSTWVRMTQGTSSSSSSSLFFVIGGGEGFSGRGLVGQGS